MHSIPSKPKSVQRLRSNRAKRWGGGLGRLGLLALSAGPLGLGLGVSLGMATGCTDGPFYQMKKMNPYFQSQWKKDQELGPTFTDRLTELDLLKQQLSGMGEQQQQQWTSQLSAIIQKDPSAEMRARAVGTVATLSSDEAVTALNFASGDDVEKVRLAACQAWKLRGDQAARDMLLSLAETDESTSVRQAAIDGLSIFANEQEVTSALTRLLDDRSPAIQFQAARSLKVMTGRDYGGDFEAWKQFMAGEDVPQPVPPSIVERAWESLPKW